MRVKVRKKKGRVSAIQDRTSRGQMQLRVGLEQKKMNSIAAKNKQ
jgi:hypothetical protein